MAIKQLLFAGLFVLLSTSAASADNCWGYYRDVYGNGQYSWTGALWGTQSEAVFEARRACGVGTRVTYIGNYCTRQVYQYNCGNTVPTYPGVPFWGITYLPPTGGGQIQYYYYCDKNKYDAKLQSLKNVLTGNRIPQAYWSKYLQTGSGTAPGEQYKCVNGLVQRR